MTVYDVNSAPNFNIKNLFQFSEKGNSLKEGDSRNRTPVKRTLNL